MSSRSEKLLVVESDKALREHIASVLRDAGYEISTDFLGGMKAVLDFKPDIVILSADPPKLGCCDPLSEIRCVVGKPEIGKPHFSSDLTCPQEVAHSSHTAYSRKQPFIS